MMVDDLSAPLGQQPKKRRWAMPFSVSQAIAAALFLFLGVFVLWAVVADDPFGGEPMVAVPVNLQAGTPAKTADAQAPSQTPLGPSALSPSEASPGQAPTTPAAGTKTITIIDGKTGQKQEVTVAAPSDDPGAPAAAAGTAAAPADQKFVEMTSHGAIPKVAADGVRPADAFAQTVKPLPGKPDAPRIAIIVGGLGISDSATSEALADLPPPVTLGFVPYGSDVAGQVARARGEGHEILLQVPMEPSDYPNNDPGPQTLLTSLAPEQNIDRLYWLMSRFQGYVGLTNAMGARFTASEPSLAPVLRETAKRGLIFVDDGSNPRSLAGQIAGANNLPFAQVDVTLDSVPSPGEIDRALSRLESAARDRGVAVGISSPLPMSIDRIAQWAKAAAGRGIQLVPISAVAAKPKQS